MSLVAYENSDESADEIEKCEFYESGSKSPILVQDVSETDNINVAKSSDDKNDAQTVRPKFMNLLPKPKNSDPTFVEEELPKRLLFSTLPLPKSSSSTSLCVSVNKNTEGSVNRNSSTISSLTNVRKKPVKITLPSLSEFNDEEEPTPKKLKPSTKGSGLFSLLPAPKNLVVKENNRKLIPRVVSKGPHNPKKSLPAVNTRKKESTALINYPDSGEESDGEDTSKIDFFSLTASTSEPESTCIQLSSISDSPGVESLLNQIPGPVNDTEKPLAFDGRMPSSALSSLSCQNTSEEIVDPVPTEANADNEENELQLSEDALQRLCGRRGRQEIAELQVIDVCGETHLPNPKEWLTKQLTEEQETRSHSHRRKDGPTTQQRRKHQITYLAFQAKEHELELKNQWAQNKMSRKQTQAKYGF